VIVIFREKSTTSLKSVVSQQTHKGGSAMTKHITNEVYLGIDVHKRTYSVTAVIENTIAKKASMPADPQVLLSFILNHFPSYKVYTVYEAGFSGLGLHRFLLANNIKSIVVHAASIEVEARSKVKNDKRDSMKMASQLYFKRLHCIQIPSPQREHWRSITRLRHQFVKKRTQCANQLKSFLYYFSLLPHTHKGKTTRKWVLSMLKLTGLDRDVFYCIQSYVHSWLYLDDKIKEINERLKIQARQDYAVGEIYRKHHGIGLITSRTLANELGDLSQFHSEDALYSYTGLTPCEYSSGDKKKLGHISRQGNTIVRQLLVEVAWE
jgi:transposase